MDALAAKGVAPFAYDFHDPEFILPTFHGLDVLYLWLQDSNPLHISLLNCPSGPSCKLRNRMRQLAYRPHSSIFLLSLIIPPCRFHFLTFVVFILSPCRFHPLTLLFSFSRLIVWFACSYSRRYVVNFVKSQSSPSPSSPSNSTPAWSDVVQVSERYLLLELFVFVYMFLLSLQRAIVSNDTYLRWDNTSGKYTSQFTVRCKSIFDNLLPSALQARSVPHRPLIRSYIQTLPPLQFPPSPPPSPVPPANSASSAAAPALSAVAIGAKLVHRAVARAV